MRSCAVKDIALPYVTRASGDSLVRLIMINNSVLLPS